MKRLKMVEELMVADGLGTITIAMTEPTQGEIDLAAGVEELRKLYEELVADSKRRDTETYCAYCGVRYPLDDQAARLVSEHIRTCGKHPMREVEKQLATVTEQRDKLLEAAKPVKAYLFEPWLFTDEEYAAIEIELQAAIALCQPKPNGEPL